MYRLKDNINGSFFIEIIKGANFIRHHTSIIHRVYRCFCNPVSSVKVFSSFTKCLMTQKLVDFEQDYVHHAHYYKIFLDFCIIGIVTDSHYCR